jgi:hypothetical protein
MSGAGEDDKELSFTRNLLLSMVKEHLYFIDKTRKNYPE